MRIWPVRTAETPVTISQAEKDKDGGDEVKYTPLAKALGTKQISRLRKELSGLKRKATGSGLTCGMPSPANLPRYLYTRCRLSGRSPGHGSCVV